MVLFSCDTIRFTSSQRCATNVCVMARTSDLCYILMLLIKLHMSQITAISFKTACAPSKDSDQLAHPRRLIKVFADHFVCNQI